MALKKDVNLDEELKALDEQQVQEELNRKNSVFGVEKMIPCPKCGIKLFKWKKWFHEANLFFRKKT